MASISIPTSPARACAVAAKIGELLASRPGARLEFMSGIDVHHNVVRVSGAWCARTGPARYSIDFARSGADGRLVKIVGFFGPPPPRVIVRVHEDFGGLRSSPAALMS